MGDRLVGPGALPRLRGPAAAYAAWGVICVVWGTTFLANKVGIAAFPPFGFSAVRFLSAGLLLQTVVLVRGRRRGGPRVPLRLGLVGIVTLGIGTGVVVWAQQWLPTGLTSVLTAATPFSMVLLEAAAPDGVRPTLRAMGGLVLGMAGIFVIAAGQPGDGFRTDYLGAVAAVLVAGVAWSAGSIVTRHQKAAPDALAVAARQMLWAGAALALASLATGERFDAPLDPRSVFALAYVVVFGSCIAFVCYLYALKHLPVAFVSTVTYVNPVLALWLGWLVLDEHLTSGVFVATALIFGGLLLTRTRRLRPASAVPHRPDRAARAGGRLADAVRRRARGR